MKDNENENENENENSNIKPKFKCCSCGKELPEGVYIYCDSCTEEAKWWNWVLN